MEITELKMLPVLRLKVSNFNLDSEWGEGTFGGIRVLTNGYSALLNQKDLSTNFWISVCGLHR